MSLNTNFDDRAELDQDELRVTGTTGPPVDGWELLSRNFIVTQGAVNVQREATKDLSWRAQRRIPPDGFADGAAVAIGTETYLYDVAGSDKPSSFITVSWSQSIRIEQQP